MGFDLGVWHIDLGDNSLGSELGQGQTLFDVGWEPRLVDAEDGSELLPSSPLFGVASIDLGWKPELVKAVEDVLDGLLLGWDDADFSAVDDRSEGHLEFLLLLQVSFQGFHVVDSEVGTFLATDSSVDHLLSLIGAGRENNISFTARFLLSATTSD